VVNAKNLVLIEVPVQTGIQGPRTFDVLAERLLHDDTMTPVRAANADAAQLLDHLRELCWRDSEIEHDVLAHTGARLAELVHEAPVGLGLAQVALHEIKAIGEARKNFVAKIGRELLSQHRAEMLAPGLRLPVTTRKCDEAQVGVQLVRRLELIERR
jgi:hypothetical protein